MLITGVLAVFCLLLLFRRDFRVRPQATPANSLGHQQVSCNYNKYSSDRGCMVIVCVYNLCLHVFGIITCVLHLCMQSFSRYLFSDCFFYTSSFYFLKKKKLCTVGNWQWHCCEAIICFLWFSWGTGVVQDPSLGVLESLFWTGTMYTDVTASFWTTLPR